MNIIITDNGVEYNNFMSLPTLKEALDIVGVIDFLVYHKSKETTDNKVSYLTKLKDKAKTLLYIREKEHVEQAVQMIVVGSGGKYLDDEFFLESSAELNRLVKNLDEITALAELGGVNVLGDFFSRYLKNGSSDFSPGYLSVVKEAVLEMIDEYKKKELEILQLAETASEIFANSAEIIARVESESEKLKSVVQSLETAKENGKYAQFSNVSAPSVLFFPQISYLKEKNIIRIKDIGGCTYLTSLMLGFRSFLEKIKNVRPKLIFVESVGQQIETKYNGHKWITQQTYRNMSNYYNEVVFTNYPSKEVISRLLEDTDYDTFIVVDRLRNSKAHILNSKGCAVKYAVSGSSVVSKFKLSSSTCFSSLKEVDGSLFTIPMFPEYPEDAEQRERLYLRSCSGYYEILYNVRRS